MADQPQTTEAERAQAASDAAAKAAQLWQGDFDEADLSIPYKPQTVKSDDESAEDDNADHTHDGDEQPGEGDNPNKQDTVEPEQYAEASQVVTVQDPGDFVPADYSFEVTLANGKTVKVSTPEQADEIADNDENFESTKQLMDFIKKSNKMQRQLDRDYDKWEAQKQTFEQQKAEEDARIETVKNLVSGFEYLESKGRLPKLTEEERNTDWTKLDVSKHPNVKAHMDLIEYMERENQIRDKAGVPRLNSALDAINAYDLDNRGKQEDNTKKAAGEARRAAGSRVASPSASSQGQYVPKGIAVGRTLNFRGGQDAWNAVLEAQQ